MEENPRDDLIPDTAAAAIISLPSEINVDDEIVNIYRQNNSQVHINHNPPSVSHQLTEEDYLMHSRPRQHQNRDGVGDTGTFTPVPMTPSPPPLLQPPYSQGYPRLGTEQVRPGMDRLPYPNHHQSPESRPRSLQTRAPQPHDMLRQGAWHRGAPPSLPTGNR